MSSQIEVTNEVPPLHLPKARRRRAPASPSAPSSPRTKAGAWLAIAAVAALTLSGCAPGGVSAKETIVVAIVANPQMKDAVSLQDDFKAKHPNVNVKFVTLPENEARAKITASVATGGGEFDVVMISNYETEMWAKNGWIDNLQPLADATPGYDTTDFIPTIKDALSYKGDMYSVPFYGESSFLVYRQDLFKQAGITMPAHPIWAQIGQIARKLNDPSKDFAGSCLRGLAG